MNHFYLCSTRTSFFRFIKKNTAIIALLFFFHEAGAQTRAIYFTGYNSSTTSFPKAAAGFNSSVVSSGSINYSGLTTVNDNRTVWSNTNTSSTLDASTAPYLSYTINLNGTLSLSLDRFVMCGLAVFNSAVKLQLRWSVDNYATSLGEFSINGSSYTLSSINLSSKGTVTANSITFRVYFYNASTWIFNSDTGPYSSLDGTPSSYGAYGQNVALWYNSFILLPLTWKSFTAKLQQESVLLTWETANEINNDHFEVEHSTDGINFSKIGEVTAGNTIYHFTHNDPAAGKNYYRIKQVDKDGKFSYSSVQLVAVNSDSKVSVYPTLVTNELTISINDQLFGQGKLMIRDMTGRTIYHADISSNNYLSIAAQNWSSGIYQVDVFDKAGSRIVSKKIVKQ